MSNENYDEDILLKNYTAQIDNEKREKLISNRDLIENFKFLCKKKGIDVSDKDFDYIHTIGIVAKYPNILSRLEQDLLIDKENLVEC